MERDETLLSVNASGRADTRPDEARLQLGVQSSAGSAAEASRANRDKMARVTAVLAKLGVKPDDIQTRNLTLQRIDYGPERGRFRADNVVEVKLRAMDKVGEAVTAATEAGANLLGGPDLRISDREASSRSAYAAAYRAARQRAEAYAAAADLKIARILAIQDAGEYGLPIPYARTGNASGMMTEQAAAPAAPPVGSVQSGDEQPGSPDPRRFRFGGKVARATCPGDRQARYSGERRRALQRLVGCDNLAELLFETAVTAIAVGMEFAHQLGIALPQRGAVDVFSQAKHAQRMPLARGKAVDPPSRAAGTKPRPDGVERIGEIAPCRRRIGSCRAERAESPGAQPE